jgi:hypothetical protein
MDDKVYIKQGKKYVEYGNIFDMNVMQDGLWMISNNKKTKRNLSFYISDLPKPVDMTLFLKLSQAQDKIAESISNLIKEKGSLSASDIASLSIQEFYKFVDNDNR